MVAVLLFVIVIALQIAVWRKWKKAERYWKNAEENWKSVVEIMREDKERGTNGKEEV